MQIRTEHGLSKSKEEYLIKYDSHIIRLSKDELYDFIKEHKKLINKNKIDKEINSIDVNLLNSKNNYNNELTL